MKSYKSEIIWEGLNVVTKAALVAGLGHYYSMQLAWFLAWIAALPVEMRVFNRSDCRAHPWPVRISNALMVLAFSWPIYTFLSSGFGWSLPLAAGAARMTIATWRLLRRWLERGTPVGNGDWRDAVAHGMMVMVSAVIIWTAVQKWEFPGIGSKQYDYYNLLAHGFSKGSLAVDMQVKPELENAPNPWDPMQRPAESSPADISYYKGKFYLYFGVVPTLLVMWPFQLLTGFDLPQVYGVIFFCVGAYWFLASLWLQVLRDHFPRSGLVTRLAGTGMLGLAGGLLAVARRGSMWELPIGAGQFFISAMLFTTYHAIQTRGRPRIWLILSGVFLGLAVGSRPTLAVAGSCLVVLVLLLAGPCKKIQSWLGRIFGIALWAGVPLALIVAGLLTYNFQRFNDPMEFGLNYQLTSVYEAKATHFSLSYVPYNLELYFLHAPSWGRYFPFVNPIEGLPNPPPGYYGFEYVYGALVTNPLLWFVLGLLVWVRRPDFRDGPAAFTVLVGAGTLSLTAILLGFNTAAARYTADFLSGWLLLGLIGWASLEHTLWPRRWLRWSSRLVFGLLMLFGMVIAYGQGAEVHGIFRSMNPDGYVRVARVLNVPLTLLERWRGVPVGPLAMEVTFPEVGKEQYEPLLVAGASYNKDWVVVSYEGPGRIRLMYQATNHPPQFSDVLEIVPGIAHRLVVECGALYPPPEHPFFDGWTEFDILARKRWVKLTLDGKNVMERSVYSHDAAPELLRIGHDLDSGRRFSGSIRSAVRLPVEEPPLLGKMDGDLCLKVVLPVAPTPHPQPLVTVGKRGEANLLLLRMLDSSHYVLGFERWGVGFWESRPLTVAEDREVDIRFRIGDLLPVEKSSPFGLVQRGVAAWVDGELVAWWAMDLPLRVNAPVSLGVNLIGSSVPEAMFYGRIIERRIEQVAMPWQKGPFRSLTLQMAATPSVHAAPILVTGTSGRANTLAMQWLENGQARLLYDHWGHPVSQSSSFAWDPLRAHQIKIEAPALAALDRTNGEGGSGRLRVWIDGEEVWNEAVSFYTATSDAVCIGRNEVDSSIASASWPGVLLEASQNQ